MTFLKYLWSLPNTLLGLLILLGYIPTSIRWHQGCIEVVPLWIAGDPGAQTWGWLIFYCHKNAREDAGLRVHERVHVSQAFYAGVFFLLTYAGWWLWYLPQTPQEKDTPWWYPAYMKIPYEIVAYRRQRSFMAGELPGAWGA